MQTVEALGEDPSRLINLLFSLPRDFDWRIRVPGASATRVGFRKQVHLSDRGNALQFAFLGPVGRSSLTATHVNGIPLGGAWGGARSQLASSHPPRLIDGEKGA